MKWISIIILFVIMGCGSKKPQSQSLMEQGIISLNQGDFEAAITSFKSLHESYPDQISYTKYLAQSYAGCGGFTAFGFYKKVKKIEEEDPQNFSQYLSALDKITSPLTSRGQDCLEKAQSLYFSTHSQIRDETIKDSNFQWSLFLAHKIIHDIQEIKRLGKKTDLNSLISLYKKIDSFLQSTFQFYLMIDYSYKPLQKISEDVNSKLNDFILTHYGEIIVSSNSERYKIFFLQTVEDNPDFLEFIISTIKSKVPVEEKPLLLMLKDELNWKL